MKWKHKSPYCLYCYAPLERRTNWASQACPRCGQSVLHADTRIYWTLDRNMVQYQWAARILTFVIAAAVCAWLFSSRAGGGTGQGWAIGFPLAIVGLGCETADKLTKFKPYFRADLAWAFLFLAPAVLLGVVMLLFGAEHDQDMILGILTVGGGLLALAVRWVAARFCRFRAQVIKRGQE